MPRKARLAALHALLLGMAVTSAGCDRRGPPKSVMPLPGSGVPPITLSRETTFITEPLTPEGLPDYVPYINEVYGEGVTPDSNAAGILAPALGTRLDDETLTTIGVDPQTIDSWPQLIGSVLRSDFEEYLDSIGKTGSACARRELRDTFVDERYTLEVDGRGSPEDFTVVSEWLDANEASMSAIAEASERRHWWIPFTQGKNLPHQPIPSLLAQRTASQAFQARAMLALGSAHWDDAVDDVLVGYRLSALTRQGGTLIEALIAGAQQDFASSALAQVASSLILRPAAARELLPKVQNAIDTPLDYGKERFFNLATLVWMWQVGDAAKWNEILEPEQFPTRDLPDGLYRIPASAVDWDEALRIVNRAHDRTDDARSYHGPQELGWTSRLEEPRLSELVERAVNDELGERLQLTEAVVAGAELIPETWPVRFRISRNESRARALTALATLALAVYRAEHGAWPSRLDELAPDYIKDVPRTEGYVFSYRASGNEIALVASPEKPNQTGHYGYCWDGTDGLHVTVDGSAHRIVDGRCHSEREARTPAQTRLGWLVAGFLGLMSAGVIARRAKMERAQVAVVLALAWTLGLLMIFLRTFEGPVTTFAQTEASELLALTISPLTIFAGGLGALTGASLLVALERHSSPWVVGALGAALTLTVVAFHPVRYVKLLGCIACLATTFLYLSTRFSKDQWCWKVAAGLLAGVTLAFPLLITAARLEVSVGIAGAVLCAVLSAGFLLSIRIDSPLKRESVVFAIGALFALVAMTWLVGPVNRAQLLMIMCVAPVVWMSFTLWRDRRSATLGVITLNLALTKAWIAVSVTSFHEAAMVPLTQVQAEVSRAMDTAVRLPEFRRDATRLEGRHLTAMQWLPDSTDEEQIRNVMLAWAQRLGVSVHGSWVDRDYSSSGYWQVELGVCLAGDDAALTRLLDRRDDLPKSFRWKSETRTESGVELILDGFALPRNKPAARPSETLCGGLDDVWWFAITEELEDSCAEWERLHPVIMQLAEYDEVERDLERRERALASIREQDGGESAR